MIEWVRYMKRREKQQLHIDDQLRKMGRRELIEVIYALQQNELEQSKQIKKLQGQLNERALKMTNTGSIAEASLALSDIFDKAQEAADQYVQSVCASENLAQDRADQILEDARNTAHQLVANAGDRAQLMVNEAQAASQAILTDAQAKATRILADAEGLAREILSQADQKAHELQASQEVEVVEGADESKDSEDSENAEESEEDDSEADCSLRVFVEATSCEEKMLPTKDILQAGWELRVS